MLLKNKARFPKKSIKGYLLDQTIISGLGNIYADEVYFMARILPSRQVQKITNAEWKNISKFIEGLLWHLRSLMLAKVMKVNLEELNILLLINMLVLEVMY